MVHSVDCFLGRPRFGRLAGTVSSGRVTRVQLRQCTTSVMGLPELKYPVATLRQDLPRRSSIL